MCACDKEHGETFYPHQLDKGCRLENQERVSVTLGFQKNICPECRGEKPVSAPISPRPGRTSKITRYYWREIAFETTRRFHAQYPDIDEFSLPEKRNLIEKEVIEEIKKQHAISPKYLYQEISQSEIIKSTNTEVILEKAEHIKIENERKVKIKSGDKLLTAEEFASEYFRVQGYSVLNTESTPFHVIFGIYMWILITDFCDPLNRIVGFGNRTEFEECSNTENLIYATLPSDFGSSGYFTRRQKEIIEHIDDLDDPLWLFDYWLGHSENFRQYLWAHRKEDIEVARKIVQIMSLENIKSILLYMTRNYWKNFCGWPDLIVYNEVELFFVEVKSSNDKLSEDQKNWLLGNHEHMHFKTKIFKIAKL